MVVRAGDHKAHDAAAPERAVADVGEKGCAGSCFRFLTNLKPLLKWLNLESLPTTCLQSAVGTSCQPATCPLGAFGRQ